MRQVNSILEINEGRSSSYHSVRPRKQLLVSLNPASDDCGADCGDYVFDVLRNADASKIIASLSDATLNLVDTATFTTINRIVAHKDKINGVEISRSNPALAVSASSDRRVCMWDFRLPGKPVATVTLPNEVMSVAIGGQDVLLAAACGTTIQFFDLRSARVNGIGSQHEYSHTQQLGEYGDIHTDIITQLKFNPANPSILASAAEDGLLCVYDVAVPEDDEAIQCILNADCPPRRFGFFGPFAHGLYCLSTTEIATLWHWSSAQRIFSFDSIRVDLGADYLVDCMFDDANDSLLIIAGQYEGDGLVGIMEPTSAATSVALQRGHSASIRCACSIGGSIDGSVGTVVTGGEDSRLCMWAVGDSP